MARTVLLDGSVAAEVAMFLETGHSRVGVRRMLAECPRLREHIRADRDELMTRRADGEATRRGAPWSHAEYERVRADMRAGEPAWRTAAALSRTVGAVRAARAVVREIDRKGRRLHG